MIALLKWLLIKHTVSAIPLAMIGSYLLAGVVEDWNSKLIVMFGVGGIAGIILAVAKLSVAQATSRKIDADTSSSQWLLIVERLQEENKAISERLELGSQREASIRLSKHDALKENQAMIFHITDCKELVAEHNLTCTIPLRLPPFKFTTLAEILEQEDREMAEYARGAKTVKA